MSAAVFATLCRAGCSVIYARQYEARALERFTNGEADWEGYAEFAGDHWIVAVEQLLVALNHGGRA